MSKMKINKIELSLILGLQLIIALFLYITLKPKKSLFGSELRLKYEVINQTYDLLEANSERSRILTEKGQHLEAAILSFQGAAANKCLFPESPLNRLSKNEPTVYELEALSQFRNAGKEQPYKQLLHLKYPNWDNKEK